ncbi:MAG: tRNA (N6-threonylcarbamoyladenosine(37)-N6)-methyltransferase TrmO [Candidatus Abyssobacteria bacterium SURF_17]|jgi:formylmethanofuran dehydrogenase subunit E|uniref:tRNA (N6-threonylcarbamoyladenosine(37)-N6)-methyltransferase TrmO n=1 Tax=Candidatus Abyssobacteria bacterium SURF_17 TaxID=2093361 RepID=A0A419F046_9BACT|nr:MAG: tRNA (N6-threonylcarbamoyladenosine(37)-N6)-methyltransferase TrmO [Candidatus Abyssubacteria bacterium SURF_17]
MQVSAIGVIHSPYKTRAEAPPQGRDAISKIEIHKEYEEGLRDIEGFSHLHVLYWMHKSAGYTLLVQTPWDSEPHGLFATRTPNRPNPVGHSIVELIERNGNVLKVKGLDAIEGTPVIDIKPYVAKIDVKSHAKSGWLEGKLLEKG